MNAREQLDAYATQRHGSDTDDRLDEAAPKAFAALRAVLDLADHYDDLGDRMWTENAAEEIRKEITTALEAS